MKDSVTIRRYTGLGENRPYFDAVVKARVTGLPPEIDDGIIQERYKIIAYADDLVTKQFPLPMTTDDAVFVRGKKLAIKLLDEQTRRIGDVLIAYEIEAVG